MLLYFIYFSVNLMRHRCFSEEANLLLLDLLEHRYFVQRSFIIGQPLEAQML